MKTPKKNKLTPKQREALNEAPLYFGQSESNLNHFYWTNGANNKWWQPRTINSLIDKGLLIRKYDRLGRGDDSILWANEEEEQRGV